MLKQYLSGFTKPLVLVVGLIIVLILPLISLPEITHADMNNTRADAWGTLEYTGSSWYGGNGVNVYSNGSTAAGPSTDTYNCLPLAGTPADAHCPVDTVQSGIEWQCVELFNRFYLTNGLITSRWSGNGNTLIDQTLPTGFSTETATATTYINPGDAITFTDGTPDSTHLGHVVIVNSVSGTGTTKTVNVVSQNTQAVLWTVSWNTSTQTLTQSYLGTSYSVQRIIHSPGGSSPSPNTKADLIVHNPTNSTYGLATSTGTAFSSQGSSLSGWDAGNWVGVGDFNKDGKADLVVHHSDNNFNVALANSTGTGFTANGTWFSGWSVGDWAGVGDFNKDGWPDIVVHDPSNNKFNVLRNNHSGAFVSYGTWYTGWSVGDWATVADVNGDGWSDIVVHDGANAKFNVLLNSTTSPAFNSAGTWYTGWSVGDWAGTGDFDKNGKADIVVHDPSTNKFNVLLSKGTYFGSYGTWYTGWSVGDWAEVADVNGDGWDDIVVHDGANAKFNVLKNSTNAPSFVSAGTWLSGWGAGDWAGMGDVNGQ